MPQSRVYLICGLLLFASAINYMDRQTLATVGKRITDEFSLTERQYGTLEKSFGFAFAAGSLAFGVLADRCPIRFIYPLVLLLWSCVGFLTGFAESYEHLLVCRGLLGFFEAGHWPCGLKAIQLMLAPRERGLGNSVLQSGTSVGAILVPLIMLATLTPAAGSWRFGFQLVGAFGLFWILTWFLIVRRNDLQPVQIANKTSSSWWQDILSRRMLVVVIIIALINATWQTLRAWLPKILQQEFHYSESFTSVFTSCWYGVTDLGCLASGALSFWLVRYGFGIRSSRAIAFGLCASLCGSLCLIPFVNAGPAVLAILLAAGAGALGLFPIYYAFSQDISREHQGKVAGVTGVIAWLVSGQTAELFGWLADETKSFQTGLAVAGTLPATALVVMVLLWPKTTIEEVKP